MNNARKILSARGAILIGGHFVYASGKHGSVYINKDAIIPYTRDISELCGAIAQRCAHKNIEAVLAPATAGVALSQWTAFHLSRLTNKEVLALYAEKDEKSGDRFVLKRGFDKLIANKRVLGLEDVVNTGGSITKVVASAKKKSANVLAVAALCNRGGITAKQLGVPEVFALVDAPMEAFESNICPLCQQGIPINTDFGHGREFLSQQRR